LLPPTAKTSGRPSALRPARIEVSALPPSDVHAPILRAAGSGPVDAGKQRILIPVDGVMYEVIVKRPTMPMLIPAGEGRSAPP